MLHAGLVDSVSCILATMLSAGLVNSVSCIVVAVWQPCFVQVLTVCHVLLLLSGDHA